MSTWKSVLPAVKMPEWLLARPPESHSSEPSYITGWQQETCTHLCIMSLLGAEPRTTWAGILRAPTATFARTAHVSKSSYMQMFADAAVCKQE